MEKVDVLVVGAGPSGSSCAAVIAESGFNVVLIEKRSSVGEPVQCAEYIPKLFLRELDIKRDFISNEVFSMKTFIEFNETIETKSPGYLIDRMSFDRALCLNAIRKGAKMIIGAKAEGIEDGCVLVRMKKGKNRFLARIIVGADGPLSTIGKCIGSRNRSFVNSCQVELLKKGDSNSTKVYFFDGCPAGYGWIFPKAETFNVGVGVGVKFKKNPQKVLDYFLDKLHLVKKDVIRLTKGLIPSGGILDTVVKDNIVLIGDAAGLTHSITGAGIPQAVTSGKMAGKVIVKSLKSNDNGILEDYDRGILELWGDYIGTALRKRKYVETNWNKGNLENTIRNTWVAFKEYYQKVNE